MTDDDWIELAKQKSAAAEAARAKLDTAEQAYRTELGYWEISKRRKGLNPEEQSLLLQAISAANVAREEAQLRYREAASEATCMAVACDQTAESSAREFARRQAAPDIDGSADEEMGKCFEEASALGEIELEIERVESLGVAGFADYDAKAEKLRGLKAKHKELSDADRANGGDQTEAEPGKRWTSKHLGELKAYRAANGTKEAAKHFGISTTRVRALLPGDKPQPKGYSVFNHS